MSSPSSPVMTLPVDNTPVPVPDEPETIPEYDTLVSSLRASLASTQTLLQSQSDRLMQLSDLEVELSTLKDQNTFIAAAKEAVETQLKDEVKRREVAEENVELLRGQVEQARRGVMVLQKQDKDRKRASLLPGTTGLGLQPDECEEVISEGPTKLTKRQSIMGRGHRRVSSQSEPGEPSPISDPKGTTTTTTKGGLRELRLGTSSAITTPDSAAGGFFDESTPMPSAPALTKRSSSSGLTASPSKSELAVKEETSRLRADVQALQKRLEASEEARVASESALKALREFMTGGSGDAAHVDEMMQRGSMNDSMASLLKGIRLPPLPTDREVEDESSTGGLAPGDKDKREEREKKIWGFKLFGNKPGAPPSPALSTAVEPPATPHLNLSPPLSSKRSSGTTPKMSPLPTPGELPTESNVSAVPPSNTPLGNFVSGWTKGIASPSTPAPPLTTRKLSSFFSRKRAGTVEGEKELPPAPTDDVVDLTDDGAAQGEEVELHAVEADTIVKPQAQVDALEPSPEIAEKANEEPAVKPEESSAELKDEIHETFEDAQTDVEQPETENTQAETAPLPETETEEAVTEGTSPAETHET